MMRRPSRGPESYYDKDLVDLVDGLFKSAALLRVGGISLFRSDGQRKTEPGQVRQLFGIDKQEMTDWRFGDWHKRSAAWPIEFVDRLISLFSEDYAHLVMSGETEKAREVHQYWRRTCEVRLTSVREKLGPHRARVEKDLAASAEQTGKLKAPFNDIEPAAREPGGEVTHRSAQISSHIDLSPPEFPINITRTDELARLEACGKQYFCVVVEGRPKAGKRYIARQFVTAFNPGSRILWIDLTPHSDFQEVLFALLRCQPPFAPVADFSLVQLSGWLKATNSILVMAGLDAANGTRFTSVVEALSRLSGPCRVIVTSEVRTGGASICEVGKLSGSEAIALLDLLGAKYDADEIRSIARETELSAFLLRQTAARFGSVDRLQLDIDMEEQQAGIVAILPERLRAAYEVLQVLNAEIDLAVVAELLSALEIEDPPRQVLAEFERLLLVRRASAQYWRLEYTGSASFVRYLRVEELKRVLIKLAAFYRRKPERDGVLPDLLRREDCMDLFAACRLLQLADWDDRQRHWLRNRFSGTLERDGAHRQLLPLYEYEVAASSDPWDAFRYARILFVVGRYDDALGVINAQFRKLVADPVGRDAEQYLSLMRLLSEILIELGRADLAARILDAAFERVDVAALSSTICTATVSVLSWALAKSGFPSECLALNEEILDRNFQGLRLPFSYQISAIRRGVALRELGDLPGSVSALEGARSYFSTEDARAFAWSTVNLAVSLHALDRHEAAEEALRASANVAALRGLANGEALTIYRQFEKDGAYPSLKDLLRSEIERLAPFEREWLVLNQKIGSMRLIEHVLLDLGVNLEKPFEFHLIKYELLSFASPHAMSSRFNRTLVRRLRDSDLESVLDEIFESKSPARIFQNHLYNRVIVEGCRENQVLVKKYILPFLDLIKAQADPVLFLYARLLEGVRDYDHAEDVLECVREKSRFSYYNIRANCAAHRDPQLALVLNESALLGVQRRQQRAQIRHNMARIVYDHDLRDRFIEAKRWCEESIRNAEKTNFYWPRNLLLKLTLAHCPMDKVEETIRSHRLRFKVPLLALSKIIDELPRGRLQNAAREAFGKIDA